MRSEPTGFSRMNHRDLTQRSLPPKVCWVRIPSHLHFPTSYLLLLKVQKLVGAVLLLEETIHPPHLENGCIRREKTKMKPR